MHILLVGGSGLVGTRPAGFLAERGHQVVCFNRSRPKAPSPMCVYELGDLGEYGQIYQIMKKYGIDQVIRTRFTVST